MAKFSSDTRRWLEAVIRQRKLLIRLNKSQKPAADVLTALDQLDRMLKTYPYSQDLHMARFVHQNYSNISVVLPGAGSSCSNKRHSEFREIHLKAIQIIADQIEFKQLPTKKPDYATLF
jgi:hypothetical protein